MSRNLLKKSGTQQDNRHYRSTNAAFSSNSRVSKQKSNIDILKKKGLPEKSNKLFLQWKSELERYTD